MPFHYEKDADGIVTLTMDMSGSANVMNSEYSSLMGDAVSRLEAEEGLTGVIIASAKKTFFAGGDLNMLIAITPENAAQALVGVEEIKGQLRRLEKLGKPVVAAIAGSALGGGFEITLASHRRIVVNDNGIRLGCPRRRWACCPAAVASRAWCGCSACRRPCRCSWRASSCGRSVHCRPVSCTSWSLLGKSSSRRHGSGSRRTRRRCSRGTCRAPACRT